LIFTSVTWGELVTDFHVTYAQFVTWYNNIFGPGGLVKAGFVTDIKDGSIPLFEIQANSTIFGSSGNGTFVLEDETPFNLQLE
jgi:hypothetical protein